MLQTTLANGLTILTDTIPGVETAAVGLYVDTGSRHEAAALNGVAHLLEHIVFKGTATRSARAIAEAIEDVGGALNAFTARDMTAFHARVLGDDVALAVELIADLVTAPRFDPAELEKERAVVLQELGEARDTPDDIVWDNLHAAAYPDQPFGRSILGDEASIAAIDADALRAWLGDHFRGGSAVLVAAGKIDHAAIVDLAERWLSALPPGTRPHGPPARFHGGQHLDRRRFEQAHMTLAWEGPGHGDANQTAANLFAVATGGGMSSRLFQELREERGLAYSIWAQHSPFADTGMTSLYCATAPADAAAARALSEEVMAATAATLDPAELARAKAQAKAGLLMSLEGCHGRSEYAARQWLAHGRVIAPAEVVARIDAVDVESVRAAGTAILAQAPARATVGLKKAA